MSHTKAYVAGEDLIPRPDRIEAQHLAGMETL